MKKRAKKYISLLLTGCLVAPSLSWANRGLSLRDVMDGQSPLDRTPVGQFERGRSNHRGVGWGESVQNEIRQGRDQYSTLLNSVPRKATVSKGYLSAKISGLSLRELKKDGGTLRGARFRALLESSLDGPGVSQSTKNKVKNFLKALDAGVNVEDTGIVLSVSSPEFTFNNSEITRFRSVGIEVYGEQKSFGDRSTLGYRVIDGNLNLPRPQPDKTAKLKPTPTPEPPTTGTPAPPTGTGDGKGEGRGGGNASPPGPGKNNLTNTRGSDLRGLGRAKTTLRGIGEVRVASQTDETKVTNPGTGAPVQFGVSNVTPMTTTRRFSARTADTRLNGSTPARLQQEKKSTRYRGKDTVRSNTISINVAGSHGATKILAGLNLSPDFLEKVPVQMQIGTAKLKTDQGTTVTAPVVANKTSSIYIDLKNTAGQDLDLEDIQSVRITYNKNVVAPAAGQPMGDRVQIQKPQQQAKSDLVLSQVFLPKGTDMSQLKPGTQLTMVVKQKNEDGTVGKAFYSARVQIADPQNSKMLLRVDMTPKQSRNVTAVLEIQKLLPNSSQAAVQWRGNNQVLSVPKKSRQMFTVSSDVKNRFNQFAAKTGFMKNTTLSPKMWVSGGRVFVQANVPEGKTTTIKLPGFQKVTLQGRPGLSVIVSTPLNGKSDFQVYAISIKGRDVMPFVKSVGGTKTFDNYILGSRLTNPKNPSYLNMTPHTLTPDSDYLMAVKLERSDSNPFQHNLYLTTNWDPSSFK